MLLTKMIQGLVDGLWFIAVLMMVVWQRPSWWDLTEDQDFGTPKIDLSAMLSSIWHEVWGPQWSMAPSFGL